MCRRSRCVLCRFEPSIRRAKWPRALLHKLLSCDTARRQRRSRVIDRSRRLARTDLPRARDDLTMSTAWQHPRKFATLFCFQCQQTTRLLLSIPVWQIVHFFYHCLGLFVNNIDTFAFWFIRIYLCRVFVLR